MSNSSIRQHLIHYTFLTICIGGFLISCCGFLVYRLILKPLLFGLILLVTLPIIGHELVKPKLPAHKTERRH